MVKQKEIYKCNICGNIVEILHASTGELVCCGQPMEKVPANICLQPDQAEHARPMADEEPCDDFRSG